MQPPSLFQDDDTRWQALCTRNVAADGSFVYGVRSTRIYCRPACKARLARRANVSFYRDAAQAQAAGFRACKRCKPEVSGVMPEEKAVRRIREYVVAADADEGGGGGDGAQRMSLARMAKEVGLSKWHFHRVFKKCVGVTPVEYLRMQQRQQSSSASSSGTQPSDDVATTPAPFSLEDLTWVGDYELDGGLDMEYNPLKGQESVAGSGSIPIFSSTSSQSGKGSSAGEPLEIDASLDDILTWPDDWWNTATTPAG